MSGKDPKSGHEIERAAGGAAETSAAFAAKKTRVKADPHRETSGHISTGHEKTASSRVSTGQEKTASSHISTGQEKTASSHISTDQERTASGRVSTGKDSANERPSPEQRAEQLPGRHISTGKEGHSDRIEAKDASSSQAPSERVDVRDDKGRLLDKTGKSSQPLEDNISKHLTVKDGRKVVQGAAGVKKGAEKAAEAAGEAASGTVPGTKIKAFTKRTKQPSKAAFVKEGEKKAGDKKLPAKDPSLKDRNVSYAIRRGKAERIESGPSVGASSSKAVNTGRVSTEKAGTVRKVSDRVKTKKTLSGKKKLEGAKKNAQKLLKKPPAFVEKGATAAAGKAAGGAAAGAAAGAAGGTATTSTGLTIPFLVSGLLIGLLLILFVLCVLIYIWYPKAAYITIYPEASVEYENNYTFLDGGTSLMQEAMTQMHNRQMAYKYKRLQGDLGPYEGLPGTKGVKSKGKATAYYQGSKVGNIENGKILEFEAPYTYTGRNGNKRDYYEFMLPASGWYGSATTYRFVDKDGATIHDTAIDGEQEYTESYLLRKILAYATVDKFNYIDKRIENNEEVQKEFIDYCLSLMDDVCAKVEYEVDYKVIEIKGDGLVSWYGTDGNMYTADTAYIEPTVTAIYNVDDEIFLNFTDAILGTFSDVKHAMWYIPEISDFLKDWTDTYIELFGDIMAAQLFGVQVPDELTYYSGLMYAGPGTIGELNENAVTVYTVLHSLGFTNQGIAGILGNLDAESGIKPNNLENSHESYLGYTDETYTSAVDNGYYKREQFLHDHMGGSDTMGAGYGIAQWTYYTRKAKLYDWAKRKHVSVANLLLQIDILVGELKAYNIYDDLRTCIDVRKASNIMVTKFERPAGFNTAAVQNARYEKCMEYFDKMDNPQAIVLTRLYAEERIDRRANEPQRVLLASMYYFEDMLQEDRAKSGYSFYPKAYNWCYTFRGFHTFEYCRQNVRECCCNQSMYWPMLDVFDRSTFGPVPKKMIKEERDRDVDRSDSSNVMNKYKKSLEPATFAYGWNPVTHNGHVFVYMGKDEVKGKEYIFDTGHGSGGWEDGISWADHLAALYAPGSPGAAFYTWVHEYSSAGSPYSYRMYKLMTPSAKAVPKYMRDYMGRRVPYTRTMYSGNVQGYIKAALDMANNPNIGYNQSYRAMQTVGGITYVDCSSFVFYSLQKAGFKLPGGPFNTDGMVSTLPKIGFRMMSISEAGQLRPGDILWWDGPGTAGHTAIYIGNNQTVEAHGRNGIALPDQVGIYNMGTFTHVFRRTSMW